LVCQCTSGLLVAIGSSRSVRYASRRDAAGMRSTTDILSFSRRSDQNLESQETASDGSREPQAYNFWPEYELATCRMDRQRLISENAAPATARADGRRGSGAPKAARTRPLKMTDDTTSVRNDRARRQHASRPALVGAFRLTPTTAQSDVCPRLTLSEDISHQTMGLCVTLVKASGHQASGHNCGPAT
jgi:hypothetical protein